MPSLRQLEYLIELSRERHFRRAAQKLGVSQPTLSMQLRALEERLGLDLIERNRNQTLITPSGQKVVEIGTRMLRAREEIYDLAKAASTPLGGIIRLGVPHTVGPHLLPLILPELHRNHPDLTLHLREDVPGNLPDALANGGHDMILQPLPTRGADLATKPIFREPLMIAMAEDHPLASKETLTRNDLQGQRVLTLEKGHQLQEQVAAICEEFGAELAFDFEGTSLDTLSQMTAMGVGITFLPGLYVERSARMQSGIAIRELSDRSLSRTIGAAWRNSSSRSEEYELLIAFIRKAITTHFPRFMLV